MEYKLKLRFISASCFLLITLVLLSACQSMKKDNQIVDSFDYTAYVSTQGCDNTSSVLLIDSFAEYLTSGISLDYSETFFESDSLLYVFCVPGAVNDTIPIEKIFIYNDNLYVVYWSEGVLTAGQNYDIVIELDNTYNFSEIILNKSKAINFVNSSDEYISIFQFENDLGFVFFENQSENYFSQTTMVTNQDGILLEDVYFDGLSNDYESLYVNMVISDNIYIEYRGNVYSIEDD